MTKIFKLIEKRVLPMLLAVALIATSMFTIPLFASAEVDPWAETGLHKPTVIDFNNGSLEGITSEIQTTEIVDGALHLHQYAWGKPMRFDAYGDIETFSVDMKVKSNQGTSPQIVFYDETYLDKDGISHTATSTLYFSYNATNGWGLQMQGLHATAVSSNCYIPASFDLTQNWVTVQMTYGTEYILMNDTTYPRYDTATGNTVVLYNKCLTEVKVINTATDEEIFTYVPTHNTYWYHSKNATYGVNRNITDAEDNEKITLGINSSQSAAEIYVDNIKVTYRNVTKVEALIEAIGTVDTSEACLAKIVRAETAFGLLTTEEQAKVSNASVLTTAREMYTNLIENAVVIEVVNLINAIGTVDASDECLAKIVAAEKAYMELAIEKQALVSNYTVLKKARADYNAAKYGIHEITEINFDNGSLEGITSEIQTTEIVDGALHLHQYAWGKPMRFDAYGDIETFSVDMKVKSNQGTSPQIVFYDETYLDKDGISHTATSTLYFSYNATNGWGLQMQGLHATAVSSNCYIPASFDLTQNWVTVQMTYGTEYILMNDTTYPRYDTATGNTVVLYNKCLTEVKVINTATDEEIFTYVPTHNTYWYHSKNATYGVNRNITDAEDNEKITLGINSSQSAAEIYVDNIKVTYRNVAKVEALIEAIGTVEVSNECLAKIELAEGAFALLSTDEKAKVSNAADIAAARNQYNNLVENADVYAVENLIDAIGVVENSEACLEKIVAAENAFAALTPEKQTIVSNVATLTAARETYDSLVYNAPIKAVEDLIAVIGIVDDSDECLAKIVAAEEAYEALDADKRAKVSNYAVLKKARADYNAAKYGLHATTEIDFNDGTLSGVTSDFKTTEIVDGALSLNNYGNGKKVRFDAYGDIATYSFDIKVTDNTQSTPQIVFYEETYKDREGADITATSVMDFAYNATNGWGLRMFGLHDSYVDAKCYIPTSYDLVNNWVTVKITYGTEYILMNDTTYPRYDTATGNTAVLYNKYLTEVKVINTATGEEIFTYVPTHNTYWYHSKNATYGVNRNVTDAEDNENIALGFNSVTGPGIFVDNIKVTYRQDNVNNTFDAIENITAVDNSDELAQLIEKAEEIYNVLPEGERDVQLGEKIADLNAKLAVVKNAAKPGILGATIRTTDITSAQNIRFASEMPSSGIDGYDVVEYGTIMFPTQYLAGNELTFDTKYELNDGSFATVLAGKATVALGDEVPTAWNAELYGIDFSEGVSACGIRISARSYVKYSNGTDEIILYSDNDVEPNSETTQGVKNGVCSRSVFSIARTMAAALLDTTTYPEESFGVIVGEIDLPTNTSAEILTFVYNNLTRLGKIAEVL